MVENQAALTEAISREAIERLLASISKRAGTDGLRSAFFYGPIGAAIFERRLGIEIFYERQALLAAALFVRANGPAHLRQMAVQDVQGMLTSFVVENFWPLGNEVMFAEVPGNFAQFVSWQTKNVMAGLLAKSHIFTPSTQLTLYPLVPVRVEQDFESAVFCFLQPAAITHDWLGVHPSNELFPDKFPPFMNEKGKEQVSSWLGVRAPTVELAERRKAAILGALALTLPRYERKQFSGRHNFGGRCTLSSRGVTESFGEAAVPPLMHDATVETGDHPWLARLAQKIASEDEADVKHCRALEYFYRAWPLPSHESFPLLFMAVDSIFSDPKPGRATQSVIEGTSRYCGADFDKERLRLLLKLRGSVIHGRAPDVHESDEYHQYLATYGHDPIADVEQVAVVCFRGAIFDDLMKERPDRREEVRRAALEARKRGGSA